MYFDNVRPVLKEVPQILLKGIFHSHPKGESKERHIFTNWKASWQARHYQLNITHLNTSVITRTLTTITSQNLKPNLQKLYTIYFEKIKLLVLVQMFPMPVPSVIGTFTL